MDSKEFSSFRKVLNKTQKQTAQLLGTSVKAIHSYEQGWRRVPAHVERQLLFLISRARGRNKKQKPCWVIKECPTEQKRQCPAWEFQAGKLCCLLTGPFVTALFKRAGRKKSRSVDPVRCLTLSFDVRPSSHCPFSLWTEKERALPEDLPTTLQRIRGHSMRKFENVITANVSAFLIDVPKPAPILKHVHGRGIIAPSAKGNQR